MALQKTYNLKGFEIQDAYHVTSEVKYNKLYNSVKFELRTYVTVDARDEEPRNYLARESHVFFPTGSYDVVGNDISTACYSYLKTLDNWSGSVDV